MGESQGRSEKDQTDTTVNDEGVTLFFRTEAGVVKVPATEAGERYASGESMKVLAEEFGVPQSSLRWNLNKLGLLVKEEERTTPTNRIAAQLPHDEVIERYEGGEPVHRIAASLKQSGIPATPGAIERVLDMHAIIRHAKPGEIPRGAPQGIPSGRLAEVVPPTVITISTPGVRSRRVRLLTTKDLEWIAGRYKGGRGESLLDLAQELGLNPSVLKWRLRNAGHEVLDREVRKRRKARKQPKRTQPTPASVKAAQSEWSNLRAPRPSRPRPQVDRPLSEQNLKWFADRHAEGKGESILELARAAQVDRYVLRRALHEAGYVVSNRSTWMRRELGRLTGDIVRMYRDEEKDFEFILGFLRARDVHVTVGSLRRLLRDRGVELRPTPRPAQKRSAPSKLARARRERATERAAVRQQYAQSRTVPTGRTQVSLATDPRRALIEGRMQELAERIVDKGESIQRIAKELGVDHNWLTRTLKQTGYLPDVPLHRYRKWKKMQAAQASS